ncbi:hypothetical protein [Nostoc sp. DSM 114167]|jgi:hypothetical protein|uniref:hypothetical protein n=1 Tax=Nostoc sp. DSM 114167 TaxID=3439050 RepID=UPI0040456F1A
MRVVYEPRPSLPKGLALGVVATYAKNCIRCVSIINPQKRNHITLKATDEEKEIFKQDRQLRGKIKNR